MTDEQAYWAAVRTVRLGVADLLDSLTVAEWDAPSLCRGWRVRDVAGHLSSVPTITTWSMMRVGPRAGFNPNRINTVVALRHGSRPADQIVGAIREHASERHVARVLDARNCLFDAIVHSQDIAIPLGREFAVPAAFSREGLERVWAMGWPFNARRRLAGLRLTATDTDWTVGAGPEVAGSALSLLLLLTGRASTVVDSLNGPGVPSLSN
ncbi:MAG TPA: maleylpyruvate isomerase family mycothiol-dependent enzyme [Jatrophihabitans sp.]|jgi:uncharacterized protein (TIGR03083 family)|uniref:maleylpyruvate isomerase family mycothiol-dependent enzyme n=1 Tax=Jatrophihabitans sp. TaxID=1932789 RepID=UPI002F1E3DD4